MRRILPVLIAALFGAAASLVYFLILARNAAPTAPPHSLAELLAALAGIGFTLPVLAAIAVWVGFSIYWSLAARGAADPRQAETQGSRVLHVRLTAAAQALVLFPLPGLRIWPASPWVTAAGFVVMATSLALAVWARQTLGRNWSGAIATNAGHALVRAGPYRWVRHPIYTALLGLYLGTALVSGEWHALLGVLIAVAAYWRKVRIEEQHLRSLFGADYEVYARETRALIPGVF